MIFTVTIYGYDKSGKPNLNTPIEIREVESTTRLGAKRSIQPLMDDPKVFNFFVAPDTP